jgi:cell division protein FtsW
MKIILLRGPSGSGKSTITRHIALMTTYVQVGRTVACHETDQFFTDRELAEELGLVGVIATLALFLALVWRVLRIARSAADAGMRFQALLAAGFGLWIGIQALINIGVTMSVLPTKGLTLPLVSYGRSSLLVTLAWLGLVLRVNHEVMARTRGAASSVARRAAAGARA